MRSVISHTTSFEQEQAFSLSVEVGLAIVRKKCAVRSTDDTKERR